MNGTNDVSQSFYVQVLQGINAPVTALNLKFLEAWHAAEKTINYGGGNTYNPFNTTLPETGSYPLSHNAAQNNGHPVQVYQTEQQGIAATVATLKHYKDIVKDLQTGATIPVKNGAPIYRASADLTTSQWGTHHIVDPLSGKTVNGTRGENINAGPEIALPGSNQKSAPGSPVTPIGGIFGDIVDWIDSWWKQAAKIILGLLLIAAGIYVMFHRQANTVAEALVK